jgi:hypothetical protein
MYLMNYIGGATSLDVDPYSRRYLNLGLVTFYEVLLLLLQELDKLFHYCLMVIMTSIKNELRYFWTSNKSFIYFFYP